MSEIDERLQQYLIALEQGHPLEDVLGEIPEDSEEIRTLLSLAAAIRHLPHPEPLLESVRAGRQAITDAARTASRPFPTQAPNWQPARSRPWGRSLIPTLAAALGLFLCVSLTFAAGGLWLAIPKGTQSATIIEVSGQVEAAAVQNGQPGEWRPVADGSQVNRGQHIRTGTDSSATLVFFDGSRTTLGPDTQLALTRLDGKRGGVLQVKLEQISGKTSHSIVPLRSQAGFFIVQTPSGEASVHGTQFDVSVTQDGDARFTVSSGEVKVSNAGSQVSIAGGQATVTSPGQAPDPPAYQFSLQGSLDAVQGNVGQILGVPIQLSAQDLAGVILQPGESVRVEGRIQDNGAWVADVIEPFADSRAEAENEKPQGSFTGVIQAIQDGLLEIGGKDVRLGQSPNASQGLAVGKVVRVAFTTQETNGISADNITTLDEPSPLPTPDPDAKPRLSFEPDELTLSGCLNSTGSPEFVFTGTLVNTANAERDYAADVVLGAVVIRGNGNVAKVEVNPVSWKRIDAGQSVQFEVRVTLDAGWAQLPAGDEVKLGVSVAHETNQPDHQRDRLTLTVQSTCSAASTPTATTTDVTPTATITPTATVSSTIGITGSGTNDCTGADPQPEGTRLAEQYKVTYEEIMGWFCQGYGFGEIDLAYSVALDSGVPVTDIFDLRKSGMGWGEIKQKYEYKNPPPTQKPKPNPKPNPN